MQPIWNEAKVKAQGTKSKVESTVDLSWASLMNGRVHMASTTLLPLKKLISVWLLLRGDMLCFEKLVSCALEWDELTLKRP